MIIISSDLLAQSLAPPKIWDKRFGGTGNEILTCFLPLADGTFLAGGSSSSGISGDKTQACWGVGDYWIVKIDPNGIKIWDKRFGGTGNDYLNGMVQLSNGKIILMGSSSSPISGDKSQASFGSNDYWIVEIDDNGNKIWDKQFGGQSIDVAYQAVETPDNKIIITGTSESPPSGNKTSTNYGSSDAWIIKIDTSGNLLSQTNIGGSADDFGLSIDISEDGFLYFGIQTYSSISGNITTSSFGSADYLVCKLDQNLNISWQKRLGGSSIDISTQVGCINNKISISGASYSGISGNKTVDNHNSSYDFWNVILDANGNIISQRAYGGIGIDDSHGNLFVTNQKNIMIAGTSYSSISGDKTQNNLGSEQAWVLLFDTANNLIWDRTVLDQGHNEIGYCTQLANGSYILGNMTSANTGGDKTQSSQGGSDYFMICLAPSAAPNANFSANQNVCVGSCINFSFTGSMYPVGTLQWNFQGGNPSTATGLNPQVCYSTPGYYDVQVIATNSLGADTLLIPNYVHVLQNVNPVLSYSGGVLVCNTGASSAAFQWYLNNVQISGATDSTFTPLINGNYTVIVNPGSVCPVTLSYIVNNLPAFIQAISANMNYLCPNNCIQFTATTFNTPTTYQWIFQGASPATSTIASPANICYPNSGNFDVTLIISNAYGSDTLFYPGYIHVLLLYLQIIVQNDTLISSTTGASYQWYLNNNPISGATNQSYLATQGGNYMVLVTSYIGCATFSNIQILGSPTASFNLANNIICSGECIQFNNTSTNLPIGNQWIFNGGSPASSTAFSPSVCFNSSGVFDVTLIEVNQFGTDTYLCSGCITVLVQPAIPVINQNGSLLSSSVSGTNYQWFLNGVLIANANSQSYSATVNGLYAVEVFGGNGCSSISNTLTININTTPTAIFSSNYTSVCQGSCIAYTDLSLNSPSTWHWIFPGGTPASSSLQNPTVCYNISGLFSVTLITHNAFGNDTVTIPNYISIFGIPSASITQSHDTLFVPQGSNSYQWTLNTNTINGATNYFYVASQSGGYNVIVTNQFGCTASNLQTLNFNPSPQSSFMSGLQQICEGNCILFINTSTNQPTSVQWIFSGGTPATSTLPNPIICYQQTGSYSVELITANATGADTFVINNYVTVTPLPVPVISIAGSVITCVISNYNGAVYSYQWYQNGNPLSGAIDSFYNVTSGGIYNVVVTGTLGCPAYSNEIILNINISPNANFNVVEFKVCPGLCTDFQDLSTDFPTWWQWNFQGGTPATSNLQNPTVCYYQPGNFYVTLIAGNIYGSDTFTVPSLIQVQSAPPSVILQSNDTLFAIVTGAIGYQWNDNLAIIPGATNNYFVPDTTGIYNVMALFPNQCSSFSDTPYSFYTSPLIDISASDTIICKGDCVNFFDQSINNPASWNWSFSGATTPFSNSQNPFGICYPDTGYYFVTLSASNQSGTNSNTFTSYIHVTDTLIPVVTESNGNLYCNYSGAGYNYQWYFNGIFIAGANSSIIQTIGFGNYTVEVTSINGCSGISSAFVFTGEAIISHEPLKIFMLDGELVITGCVKAKNIFIYNSIGQLLTHFVPDNNSTCIIPLHENASACFIVEIVTTDSKVIHQLIIQP